MVAFLDASTGFTGHRARFTGLYSDNCMTFVGKNKLLQQDVAIFALEGKRQALADFATTWHFIAQDDTHQGDSCQVSQTSLDPFG